MIPFPSVSTCYKELPTFITLSFGVFAHLRDSKGCKCLPNSAVPMNPSGKSHLWPNLSGQRLARLADDFVRSGSQSGNLDHLKAGECVCVSLLRPNMRVDAPLRCWRATNVSTLYIVWSLWRRGWPSKQAWSASRHASPEANGERVDSVSRPRRRVCFSFTCRLVSLPPRPAEYPANGTPD